jgi:hypothetical protein
VSELAFLLPLAGLFAFVFLVALLKRRFADPARVAAEEEALRRFAERHRGRLVPAADGGPAARFDAEGGDGDARFRPGKHSRRFPEHVRVRLPFREAEDVRLLIVPAVIRRGRRNVMVHPAPLSLGNPELDGRYDFSAPSRPLLDAVLAQGGAELLLRLHPRLWMEVKNGRVEVRLAGPAGEPLVTQAAELARTFRARAQGALRSRGRRG